MIQSNIYIRLFKKKCIIWGFSLILFLLMMCLSYVSFALILIRVNCIWYKCLPAMRETWVWSLGREDPLEKEMATHSSILAWRIPWTEEPGGLQSTGLQRVGHDWATSLSFPFLSQWFSSCIPRIHRGLRRWLYRPSEWSGQGPSALILTSTRTPVS